MEPSASLIDKLKDLAEKHWKLVLVATVASAAVGGVTYYALKDKSSKKPKKLSKRASSTTSLSESPNVDKSVDSSMENIDNIGSTDGKFVATSEENALQKQENEADDEQTEELAKDIDYSQLSEEELDNLAQAAKSRGNKYFSAQRYDKAVTLYTKAIQLYPNQEDKKCAVFYSNRAACWYNLGEYDKVIADATAALKIEPLYVKAMLRRGNAYEKKEMFAEALNDLTTACILEEFKIQSTLMSADRALRGLVSVKSKEIYEKNKRQELPSLAFVSAFLNSFRYDYKVSGDDDISPGSGDALYAKAANAFARHDWEKADKLLSQALEATPEKYIAKALNMHGTFAFLKGDSEQAKKDLEESLKLEPTVNVLIKMASLQMELNQSGGPEEALAWFDKAIKLDPSDPDIYYHRGQIYFLVQDYAKAVANYEKSLELDDKFVLAKIQMAIVNYRQQNFDEANRLFEQAKRQHPKNADVHYYHGEILLDQQKVDDATAEFDKAIQINPNLPLPYLNKGIVFCHLKGDFERAVEFTQKAISVDSRCDLAYTHLAQMFMQQGKLDEAIITYKRAVDLARSFSDIENAVMGLEAVKAQLTATSRIKQNMK